MSGKSGVAAPQRPGVPVHLASILQPDKILCITPSMSRRANPYDNAMAENFFSILKTECIYRHKPASFCEANEMIDRYINFYNYERIQLKTGVAPLTLRHSA